MINTISELHTLLKCKIKSMAYFKKEDGHFFRLDIDDQAGELYKSLRTKAKWPALVVETSGINYPQMENGYYKERMIAFSVVENMKTDLDYDEFDSVGERAEEAGEEILNALMEEFENSRCPIRTGEIEATRIWNTAERFSGWRWSLSISSYFHE